MPIEIQCEHCQRKLRVADKFAGKRGKCPNCQAAIDIPALPESAGDASEKPEAAQEAKPAAEKPASEPAQEPAQAAVPKPAAKPAPRPAVKAKPAEVEETKEEWYMKVGEGDEYGPVSKAELDAWVKEGRVDTTCQLLREGWSQWKWAEELYPDLSEGASAEDASPETPATETADGFDLDALSGGQTSESAEDDPLAGIGYGSIKSHGTTKSRGGKSSAKAVKGGRDREAKPEIAPEGEAGEGLSPKAKQSLKGTLPWLKFFAILLFIGAAMLGLGTVGILLLALGALMHAPAVGAVLLIVALVCGAAAGGYGYAGYCLFKYASQTEKYLRRGVMADLELAFAAQKAFSKFVGIITAAALVLSIVAPILLTALGGAAALVGGMPKQ